MDRDDQIGTLYNVLIDAAAEIAPDLDEEEAAAWADKIIQVLEDDEFFAVPSETT